ncbi:MAG: universal stress protein [Acidobacteriota bacterium]
MVKITKILCPMDFSGASKHSLAQAIMMARWHGATVTMIQVRPDGHPMEASERRRRVDELARLRSIPFPSSNIIFDTQTDDPAAGKKSDEPRNTGTSTTSTYASVSGGWQGVEQSAVAISETANLILIPGRLCENGKPVPLDRDDFKRFSQGLAGAGKTACQAAKSKNLDAMVEVSGTVSDACAACHEKYRDVPEGKERCI